MRRRPRDRQEERRRNTRDLACVHNPGSGMRVDQARCRRPIKTTIARGADSPQVGAGGRRGSGRYHRRPRTRTDQRQRGSRRIHPDSRERVASRPGSFGSSVRKRPLVHTDLPRPLVDPPGQQVPAAFRADGSPGWPTVGSRVPDRSSGSSLAHERRASAGSNTIHPRCRGPRRPQHVHPSHTRLGRFQADGDQGMATGMGDAQNCIGRTPRRMQPGSAKGTTCDRSRH